MAERADSNIIPSMGTREPKTKTPQQVRRFPGGEGGIRTREPLWVTRFPSVRAKPDYATSPFLGRAGELYQRVVHMTSNKYFA
jgi:hypothetical protein